MGIIFNFILSVYSYVIFIVFSIILGLIGSIYNNIYIFTEMYNAIYSDNFDRVSCYLVFRYRFFGLYHRKNRSRVYSEKPKLQKTNLFLHSTRLLTDSSNRESGLVQRLDYCTKLFSALTLLHDTSTEGFVGELNMILHFKFID